MDSGLVVDSSHKGYCNSSINNTSTHTAFFKLAVCAIHSVTNVVAVIVLMLVQSLALA